MNTLIRIAAACIAFIFSQTVKAQDTAAFTYFNKGLRYYNEGKLDTALIIWEDIVKNNRGYGTDVYGYAFYNIPNIYWSQKNIPKAKEWFKKVLDSELLDGEETGNPQAPYVNYKHNSALMLADIEQYEGFPTGELHWLHLADTVYRYWGIRDDKSSVMRKHSYILARRIEIYKKMEMQSTMIQQILLSVITADSLEDHFAFPENELFKVIPDKTAFLLEFNKSLNAMKVVKHNYYSYSAIFHFKGLQYVIPIRRNPPLRAPVHFKMLIIGETLKPDKKFVKQVITSKEFYKSLSK